MRAVIPDQNGHVTVLRWNYFVYWRRTASRALLSKCWRMEQVWIVRPSTHTIRISMICSIKSLRSKWKHLNKRFGSRVQELSFRQSSRWVAILLVCSFISKKMNYSIRRCSFKDRSKRSSLVFSIHWKRIIELCFDRKSQKKLRSSIETYYWTMSLVDS